MRFFVALEIPEENKKQFQQIQINLQNLLPKIRLTDLEKIHLTLAFIGEQPDHLKDNLASVIKQAAYGIPNFEVTPAYIDGFPNIHHPQNLWVGVKGDIDKILLIRERVKDGLEILHLPVDERRFIPHVTIAKFNNHIRIYRKLEVELEKIMTMLFDPIKISSIKLFESIPSGDFHKHNTLAEVRLL
ncbi:RNA 2',3'-cyclic phosphodiesterase [Candidatus Daviesbacteria bacterium]|nr:RNA 2',3'-cyclic phosphodiesterase [Candidatus Daviesbacteria bacterium]MBI4035326.1 RNA 2',3'-cyclic phosphodiesterase [Candidatus Daviesbacteria bacterium]